MTLTTSLKLSKEEWKPIAGYEGIYLISNLGRIMSCARTIKIARGHIYHMKEKIMSPGKTKAGYRGITLCKNGKQEQRNVHRLVATTFLPNPENLPQVNHKNGNPSDNRVENLEWCTGSWNQRHAFITGLRKSEDCARAKLSREQVLKIRELYPEKRSGELSKMFGVSHVAILEIVQKKSWKMV